MFFELGVYIDPPAVDAGNHQEAKGKKLSHKLYSSLHFYPERVRFNYERAAVHFQDHVSLPPLKDKLAYCGLLARRAGMRKPFADL